MPQLFCPPRPLPAPLEPSPPLDPASMPLDPASMPHLPPPAAPVAAAEDEERPSAPMLTKIRLLFPRAVHGVFGGVNRAWGAALVGLHVTICIVKVVSFTTDPEEARFWERIFRAWLHLCFAAILLMTCVRIYYCLPVHGVDAVKDNLPKQQLAAAAAVQLPPPPPEMDMC